MEIKTFGDFEIKKKETSVKDESEYAHWVRKTAEMLDRPYFAVHKMVEDWAVFKIKNRYEDAIANENPQKYWWGLRKWENKNETNT